MDIIFLTICAVINGAEGWESIKNFGREKIKWLRKFTAFENGIPSHDCIDRVMARLSPEQLTQCFVSWVKSVSEIMEGEIVAIDGKTARRAYDSGKGMEAIHMVSAWASSTGLSLGQLKTEKKSNEITVIPVLLDIMDLKGCIVTIDAMGCQTEISAKIQKKGVDYVLAVKGNQDLLEKSIKKFFEMLPEPDLDASLFSEYARYYEKTYAGHGRVEVRKYFLSSFLETFPKAERWAGLRGIGMVEAEHHIGYKVSFERRYYIASFSDDAKKLAQAVRKHWGVENSSHWVLDVTFREE